jgi:hypothetical protein
LVGWLVGWLVGGLVGQWMDLSAAGADPTLFSARFSDKLLDGLITEFTRSVGRRSRLDWSVGWLVGWLVEHPSTPGGRSSSRTSDLHPIYTRFTPDLHPIYT